MSSQARLNARGRIYDEDSDYARPSLAKSLAGDVLRKRVGADPVAFERTVARLLGLACRGAFRNVAAKIATCSGSGNRPSGDAVFAARGPLPTPPRHRLEEQQRGRQVDEDRVHRVSALRL